MQLSGYGNSSAGSLDATFAALADPTRRAILARLAEGERTVTELAEPFALSQPAISKHLKVLERAHLISRDRDAQRRPSRLEAAPLAEASLWLERYRDFWEASFERLDALLSSLQQPQRPPKSAGRGARDGKTASKRSSDASGAKGGNPDGRRATDRSTEDTRNRRAKTAGSALTTAPKTLTNRGTRSRGKQH